MKWLAQLTDRTQYANDVKTVACSLVTYGCIPSEHRGFPHGHTKPPGGIDFAAKRRVLTGGGSGRVAHEGKRMRAVARIQGARDVAPVATVTERCVERLEARAIALQQSAVQRWRGCGARCADNPDAQWARVEAAR